MPQISVILPVFNAVPFLRQAIESVLTQTFADFELIVINDGSTDRSDKLLAVLAGTDSRIHLLHHQNSQGISQTINAALQIAEGQFIARMDADDICMPRRFEIQHQYLIDHAEVGIVGSRILQIDPEGSPICDNFLLQHHDELDQHHLNFLGSAIAHPSVMARKACLDAAGGYRPELEPAEDLDLWLRLAERTRLANIPEPLLKYRLHENSVSHGRRAEQQAQMVRAVQQAVERRTGSVVTRQVAPPPPGVFPARIQWARMAFDAGEMLNARALARKAVIHHPGHERAWRGLAASLIGNRRRKSEPTAAIINGRLP